MTIEEVNKLLDDVVKQYGARVATEVRKFKPCENCFENAYIYQAEYDAVLQEYGYFICPSCVRELAKLQDDVKTRTFLEKKFGKKVTTPNVEMVEMDFAGMKFKVPAAKI